MRVRTAIELREMGIEMAAAVSRLREHLGQTSGRGLEDVDLSIDPGTRIEDQRTTLVRVATRAESFAVPLANRLILQQTPDLGKREPRVIAQTLDEAEAFEIGVVEQAVGAVRAGGRLEESDLLVIADRAGGQARLGCDLLDLE